MVDSITRFGLTVTWDRLLAAYAVTATLSGACAILAGPGWFGMLNAFICGVTLTMISLCHVMILHRHSSRAMMQAIDALIQQNEALGLALAEACNAPPISPEPPTTH